MNIRNLYFYERSGHEFETEFADIAARFARTQWGKGSIKFSTIKQDRFEGTDLFVLGVPIDITLAYEKKTSMRQIGSLMLEGLSIEFGIRFGNGKSRFKTPVLVIGAESALGITKGNMWIALETIKAHIQQILDTGMDSYFEATEA